MKSTILHGIQKQWTPHCPWHCALKSNVGHAIDCNRAELFRCFQSSIEDAKLNFNRLDVASEKQFIFNFVPFSLEWYLLLVSLQNVNESPCVYLMSGSLLEYSKIITGYNVKSIVILVFSKLSKKEMRFFQRIDWTKYIPNS